MPEYTTKTFVLVAVAAVGLALIIDAVRKHNRGR
jgi:hypothetical protein